MNAYVEGGAGVRDNVPGGGSTWYPDYRAYFKESDLTAPAPAQMWLFLDEHPDSINDGWLESNMDAIDKWQDVPSCLHNNACDFNFADGHSEVHKWLSLKHCLPVVYDNNTTGIPDPNSPDLRWLHAHTSVLVR